jgi:hypothetical protein
MGTVAENPPPITGVGGGTGVGVTVGVQVGTRVLVAEGSGMGDGVGVAVGLAVGDGVRVGVNVGRVVRVGEGEGGATTSTTVLVGAMEVTVLFTTTMRSRCSI